MLRRRYLTLYYKMHRLLCLNIIWLLLQELLCPGNANVIRQSPVKQILADNNLPSDPFYKSHGGALIAENSTVNLRLEHPLILPVLSIITGLFAGSVFISTRQILSTFNKLRIISPGLSPITG